MVKHTQSGTTPQSGESGAAELQQTAMDAKASAEQAAEELRDDIVDGARQTAEQTKQAAIAKGEAAKAQATGAIAETAGALDRAAAEVDEGSVQQQLLSQAADGLTSISEALRGKSLGEMVDDVSDFARKNPVAFVGGAALAGFALSRFARASAPERDHDTRDYYRPPQPAPTGMRPEPAPSASAPGPSVTSVPPSTEPVTANETSTAKEVKGS